MCTTEDRALPSTMQKGDKGSSRHHARINCDHAFTVAPRQKDADAEMSVTWVGPGGARCPPDAQELIVILRVCGCAGARGTIGPCSDDDTGVQLLACESGAAAAGGSAEAVQLGRWLGKIAEDHGDGRDPRVNPHTRHLRLNTVFFEDFHSHILGTEM